MKNKILKHFPFRKDFIKIERDGLVYRATRRGKDVWFIPINDEKFAHWAFRFIEIHNRYLEALKKGDIIAEVGACTGEYTIPAALRVGEAGRVFAFEADPMGCECTRRNAELHNINNIEVINAAIMEKVGKQVSLDIVINLSGGRIINDVGGPLLTTTLDDYFKDTKVDVIKLTVNGSEPEVLKGAQKLLRNVRSVIFQSKRYKELIGILEGHGFRVKNLENADESSSFVKVGLLEQH